MKKWMVVPILIVALFLGLPNHATATETAKNDTVYVAGNPDLFPFEYYDTRRIVTKGSCRSCINRFLKLLDWNLSIFIPE